MVKVCKHLPSSANDFENCQTLATVGKMMQDVTYCVHNNFTHYFLVREYRCRQCFVFIKIVQICSMSKRFSTFARNIGVWSGAEVCRSSRSTDLEKCRKRNIHLKNSASIQSRTSPPKFAYLLMVTSPEFGMRIT